MFSLELFGCKEYCWNQVTYDISTWGSHNLICIGSGCEETTIEQSEAGRKENNVFVVAVTICLSCILLCWNSYCCNMFNLCGLTLWWTCGLVVLLCGRVYWLLSPLVHVLRVPLYDCLFRNEGMNASLVSIESHLPRCSKGWLRKPSNGFSPISTVLRLNTTRR